MHYLTKKPGLHLVFLCNKPKLTQRYVRLHNLFKSVIYMELNVNENEYGAYQQ